MHNKPNNEKPKDFVNALKKLFSYLSPYKVYIFTALLLAIFSSVLSIIGPNKVSDLTNMISDGITLKTDEFTELTSSITEEITQDKIIDLSHNILSFKLDQATLLKIQSSNPEDLTILTELQATKAYILINKLSDNTKNLLLPDTTYNDVIISTDDSLSYINLLSTLTDSNTSNEDKMNSFMSLPTNILASLLSTSTIDNIEVTNMDKALFITAMNNVSDKTNAKELYAALDTVPDNISKVIKPTMDLTNIKKLCIFLISLYIASALFNFFQGFIMATISNDFAQKLREKISHKINKLPLKYYDAHESGDILSRVT